MGMVVENENEAGRERMMKVIVGEDENEQMMENNNEECWIGWR